MKRPALLSSSLLLLSLLPSFASASSPPHGHPDPLHLNRFNRKQLNLDQESDIVQRSGGDNGLSVRDGPEKMQLVKRSEVTNGRATWYADGLGACGITNSPSDFIIAISFAQYGDTSAVSPLCFQYVTISYGGKSTQAQIVDACQACPSYTGIDMSEGLFSYFADTSVGVLYVDWYIDGQGGSSSTSSSSTHTTPSSTYTPPKTTSTPTSTYTPPTSTYTPPSSTYTPSSTITSSSAASSLSTVAGALVNATLSTPLVANATLSSLAAASSSSASVAAAAAASSGSSLPSASIGGNLDRIPQLVIALAEVAGSAANNAVISSSA